MGFIDWHGNKEDHYDEVLEFAKMKERMESDNFGSLMKKKADAKLFGVPNLVSMENGELLQLLLKEKKGLDVLYRVLVNGAPEIEQLHIRHDMTEQFYHDFLLCSIDQLFYRAKVEKEHIQKFADTLMTKIFKSYSQISIKEHYQRLESNKQYRDYLSRSFELKSGNVTFFWQWIQYLSTLSAKRNEAGQFVNLHQYFMMHLAYYMNQLIPNAEVGKYYAERRKLNSEILQSSLETTIDLKDIFEKIENPIFRIREEEEKKRRKEAELTKRMAAETVVKAAEEDTRRLERLEAIKTAELKRQKQLEQEAKERLERLKEAKIGAEERAERIRVVEQEVRERAEQIRIAELEMQRLAELEARELAEYIRLAELEAKERAELEAAERKRQAEIEAEERRKRFISLMKCAKMTLGFYVIDIEDESDMVTAGRLYSEIRDKKIILNQMASIFPAESAAMAEQGILPIISNKDVKYSLQERELLHYVEYVTIYMQGADEETIEIKDGALYITNQRIQLMTGRNVFTIPYEYLKKAVLYDVMPEIIEISSSKANYFVRTANTELTYKILKMVLYNTENIELQTEPEPMNMEDLSIDFLKKADMESYIFGIKTLMDAEMPETMQNDLVEMTRSLEYLNIALKKYPSFEEQSYNFFSYYIPEVVKILYSYNEYEKAGLREKEKNPVYEKVMIAVRKVSAATKQQVVEIYKKAIVDTTARAEALAEILGQDGFVDPMYSIR